MTQIRLALCSSRQINTLTDIFCILDSGWSASVARRMPVLMAAFALALCGWCAATNAAEPPRRFPLIPIEAFQDGEDMAAGITDYYAGFEAFALVFSLGDAGRDHNGNVLAASVTVEFDAALAGEMGWRNADGEPASAVIRRTFEAPGQGWAIERTYAIPYSTGLILSAYQDDAFDRLVVLDMRVDEGTVETLATVDARSKLDTEDAPEDWPFPTYPAVIETGSDVPSARRREWNAALQQIAFPDGAPKLASLIWDGLPASLAPVLPREASLGFSEWWWRNDIRGEHLSRVERLSETLGNAVYLLADAVAGHERTAPTAQALAVLRPIVDGAVQTASLAALTDAWTAHVFRASPDGEVNAFPPQNAVIRADGNRFVFEVTGGTYRPFGQFYRLTHGAQGHVLLGAAGLDGEPAPTYSGYTGPYADFPPQSDIAGVLYVLGPDHGALVLNADDAFDWTLIELRRR